MRIVAWQITVYLLLLSGWRFNGLLRQQIKEYRRTERERSVAPTTAALHAVTNVGTREDANLGPTGYLVIFVIHHKRLDKQVAFWNRVVQLRSTKAVPGRIVKYWGVCDDGDHCNDSKIQPQFQMVAFLEPYQAYTLSIMDERHQALIYDHTNRLKDSVLYDGDAMSIASRLEAGVVTSKEVRR